MAMSCWVLELIDDEANEDILYAAVSDGPIGTALIWTTSIEGALQFAREQDVYFFADLVGIDQSDYRVEQHYFGFDAPREQDQRRFHLPSDGQTHSSSELRH